MSYFVAMHVHRYGLRYDDAHPSVTFLIRLDHAESRGSNDAKREQYKVRLTDKGYEYKHAHNGNVGVAKTLHDVQDEIMDLHDCGWSDA